MKVKFIERKFADSIIVKEVEINEQFPFYRKGKVMFGNYQYYYKILSEEKAIIIRITRGFENKIEKVQVNTESFTFENYDFLLGQGDYSFSEKEYQELVKEITAFLNNTDYIKEEAKPEKPLTACKKCGAEPVIDTCKPDQEDVHKLNPCAFCGDTPIYNSTNPITVEYQPQIMCLKCGSVISCKVSGKNQLVEIWNELNAKDSG